MKHSLIHLEQSLRSLGAELVLIKAESTLTALLNCITAVGATKLVFNHLYDPVSLVRDHSIKQKLGELGVSVQTFNGELMYEPWEVYDSEKKHFTTFNAFYDKCLLMQGEPASHLTPWRLVPCEGAVIRCLLEKLGLEADSEKSSNALLGRGWSPGWSNADKALTVFVEHHLFEKLMGVKKVKLKIEKLMGERKMQLKRKCDFVYLDELVFIEEKKPFIAVILPTDI